MKPINTRSPKQWEIISKHIDFKGKSVIDLGCGYGDILFRCWEAEARVTGIEKDSKIQGPVWEKFWETSQAGTTLRIFNQDIESMAFYRFIDQYINDVIISRYDVSICFSVLPYLKDPNAVLTWMYGHSEIALIECQYAGDGPGFTHIKNDTDMEAWLKSIGWQSVEMIGRTLVKGRDKERSIWLCR